jgi:hypothetical protein
LEYNDNNDECIVGFAPLSRAMIQRLSPTDRQNNGLQRHPTDHYAQTFKTLQQKSAEDASHHEQQGGSAASPAALALKVTVFTTTFNNGTLKESFWLAPSDPVDLDRLESVLRTATGLELGDVYDFAEGEEQDVVLGRGTSPSPLLIEMNESDPVHGALCRALQRGEVGEE